jgi:hypothetical protein
MMRTTQLYQAMVNSSSICCRGPRNDVAAQVASLTRPSSVISLRQPDDRTFLGVEAIDRLERAQLFELFASDTRVQWGSRAPGGQAEWAIITAPDSQRHAPCYL